MIPLDVVVWVKKWDKKTGFFDTKRKDTTRCSMLVIQSII